MKSPKAPAAPVFARGIPRIQLNQVFDLLSDFLSIRQSQIQLYSLARDRAPSAELRELLEAGVQRTEIQAERVQTAIRDLGGNPVHLSPSAQVHDERARLMATLSAPSRLQPLVDIENLVLTETLSGNHARFLRSLLPSVDDPHAQDVLTRLLDEDENETIKSGKSDDSGDSLHPLLHRLMLAHLLRPATIQDKARPQSAAA